MELAETCAAAALGLTVLMLNLHCDETKPGCKRCDAYGVSCSYNPNSADLQPFFVGTTTMKQNFPKAAPCPIIQGQANESALSMTQLRRLANASPIVSDGYAVIEMDTQFLERLRCFY